MPTKKSVKSSLIGYKFGGIVKYFNSAEIIRELENKTQNIPLDLKDHSIEFVQMVTKKC